MQQIKEKLFLGNLEDVINWSNNPERESSIIIYLGQLIPNKICFGSYPTIIHVPIIDGENLLLKLANVVQIIFSIVDSYEGEVMIACRAGMSRSVLTTTAVYALTENINFDEALLFIKKKCPQSLPEQNLQSQIKEIVEGIKCCI